MKFRNARKYLAPLDSEGAGDDGGSAIDRGDAGAAAAAEADAAVAAEPVAADAAAEERDDKGRFTKKETPEEPRKKGVIPVDRHERILDKERGAREAAERRAAELEKQIKHVGHGESLAQIEKDIEVVEDKLEKARMDGDKEQVKRLAKDLRLMERQISIAESSRMSEAAKEGAREEIRMDMTIEKLESQFPILNNASNEFDSDIVDLILATSRDLTLREHMTPSKALEAAAKKVMAKLMPAHNDGGDRESGGLKDAKLALGDRKEAQVKKNLETAKKQPASLKESGIDSDKAGQTKDIPNASTLTYEEFAALPEATKAKMRGDTV